MKNQCFIFLFLLCSTALVAQQGYGGRNSGRTGFYISPMVETGPMDVIDDLSVGLSIGMVSNKVSFGLYGMTTGEYPDAIFNGASLNRFDYSHVGINLMVHPHQRWIVHPFFGFKMGYGVADFEFEGGVSGKDPIFVLSPELGLELNVSSFFRLAGYGGYRFIEGEGAGQIMTDGNAGGFFAGVALRFGSFGRVSNKSRTCIKNRRKRR